MSARTSIPGKMGLKCWEGILCALPDDPSDPDMNTPGLKEKLERMSITDELHVKLNTEANAKHRQSLQKTHECTEKGVRPDITVYAEQDGPDKVFLILELKCRYFIKRDDLNLAMRETEEQHDVVYRSTRTKSLLVKRSYSEEQIKQVCTYAQKRHCNFVALSDWESLVLFDLEPNAPPSRQPFRRANVTIVPKGRERLALLGFMEKALQTYLLGKNKPIDK
ncbi:hypothetical protein NX059_012345 [Plenodomus lindquistii]|nr:hypothetical protein NX059_012345 [Plenodomus lindquistii]